MRAPRIIPLLSLLVLPLTWCTQSAPQAPLTADPASVPPSSRYAAEPLVIDHLDTIYRMHADGTGMQEESVEATIQSESALKQLAVLSLGFAANSQKVQWLYARIRHKDGTVTETPVDSAIEVAEQVTREAPFYSDLKEMQLPLKDLRVGDHLEWKARTTLIKAEAPGQFWGQHSFSKNGVLLSETLELNVPKDQYVNVWSPAFKPAEASEGETRTYRWTFSQLDPTVGPAAEAHKEAEKKRPRTEAEELDERKGKLPDVAWTTFKDWQAVGAWYRGLEGERMVPDADVKAKVTQLTAGKTTDLAKIEAVYTYVATQIHYIGVAFGVGRYQPHSAADVLANQYGDCKDKHTLLAAMLGALDLKPDAVLIGAGIRFNEAVPSPSVFNHLITHLVVDGKPLWLDTTAEVAPFGMLIYATRDEQALVVPEIGAASVERTPKSPPFPAVLTMEAKGSLDADGTSNSHISLNFRGDDEIVMRAVVRQLSPAQYDLLAQQICVSMGYGGTANHFDSSRAEDTTIPFQVGFDYKRVKGGDWVDLKIVPQLYPVQLPRPDEKEPPVESLPLGIPRVEIANSEMKIPDGWTAELPEAVHVKSAWVNYDLTYRFDKGSIYAQRRVEILQDRVPLADWKAYSKFAEKVDIGGETFIQLIRKAAPKIIIKGVDKKPTEDKVIVVDNSDPAKSAASEMEDAEEALRHNNTATAEPLLNRVKELNPAQPRLWAGYGYLNMQHGEISIAIQNFQKELSLHPSEVEVYPVLVQAMVYVKRRADAQVTLRQWADAAPEDSAPLRTLAAMQMEDGANSDAITTATAAIARTTPGDDANERLRLLLGQLQLKAGSKDQGHQTLATLLKSTENPDIMNDVAYELANAGFELPLAEQTTRTALDKMEEESRTWTLDENPRTLRSRTQMIQATWDTMGWIGFKQGKLKLAEDYVRAAWQGRQTAEVGGHLAEIDLSKGDRNAAVTQFQLAVITGPGYDAMGVRQQQNALQKELTERAETLTKQGAQSTTYDSQATLERLRKLPLGSGESGVAEYKILASAQGIVRAEPTGEKQVPGALEKLKRAKMQTFFPTDSKAQLMFLGMLNCHSGTCELILEP